jgi:hypothetical protein
MIPGKSILKFQYIKNMSESLQRQGFSQPPLECLMLQQQYY